MRRWIGVVAVVLLAGTFVLAQEPEEPSPFATQKETVSYGIGLQYGRSARQAGADLDIEKLIMGIRDGLSGAEAKVSDKVIQDSLATLRQEIMEKQAATLKEAAEKNLNASTAFMEENAKKEGVVVLPDGLQYKVITAGTGAGPDENDSVTVNYTGKLIDGTVFDSTDKRNEPATFLVNQVIPGWSEALEKMKIGDKWELYIPPSLAYGEMGAGGVIGPNQALIFEVELLDVKKIAVAPKPTEGAGADVETVTGGDAE